MCQTGWEGSLGENGSMYMHGWVTLQSTGNLGGIVVKNPATKAGDARDAGLILGSLRSPGVRNGNSL